MQFSRFVCLFHQRSVWRVGWRLNHWRPPFPARQSFFPVVEWMKHRPVDMRRALCFIEQHNPRHFDSLILERRPLGGLGSGARHYWFNSFSSWPLVLNELLRLDLLLAAKWRRHQGRSRPLDVTPSICSCSKFWLLKIFKIKKFIENSVRPNHSITEL